MEVFAIFSKRQLNNGDVSHVHCYWNVAALSPRAVQLSKESMATIAWLPAEIVMHCLPPHVCCSMGSLTERGIHLAKCTNNLKPSHPKRSLYVNVHFGLKSAPAWMFYTHAKCFSCWKNGSYWSLCASVCPSCSWITAFEWNLSEMYITFL